MRILARVRFFLCAAFCLSFADAHAADVYLLSDGAQSVKARMDLFSNSSKEWLISHFEWHNDALAKSLLARARAAARKGMKVKILADAYGNHIPKDIMAALIDAGVEIREFHPMGPNMPVEWLNRRMHDKLNIFDGESLFVGGRNAGSGYFDIPTDEVARFDREILINHSPETVRKAREYFLEVWESEHVAPPRTGKPGPAAIAKASAELDRYESLSETAERTRYAEVSIGTPFSVADENIQFLHDPVSAPYKKPSNPGIADNLVDLISGAKTSVQVETPFVAPTKKFLDAFDQVAARDVPISIFTNSADTNDRAISGLFFSISKKSFSDRGLTFVELSGEKVLHSKSIVVDDERAFIGSFNLNGRSANRDTETGVIIKDKTFAVALKEDVQRIFRGRSTVIPAGDARGAGYCGYMLSLALSGLAGSL